MNIVCERQVSCVPTCEHPHLHTCGTPQPIWSSHQLQPIWFLTPASTCLVPHTRNLAHLHTRGWKFSSLRSVHISAATYHTPHTYVYLQQHITLAHLWLEMLKLEERFLQQRLQQGPIIMVCPTNEVVVRHGKKKKTKGKRRKRMPKE